MSRDRIEPPARSMWARAVAAANAKTEAKAKAAGGRAFSATRLAARVEYQDAKSQARAADTPEKEADARAAVAKAKEALRRALPKPVRHAGVRRRDLWQTWLDVLAEIDGKAADRLEAAMRHPMRSEALVGALQTWEATDNALADARARLDIPPEAVAVRLREAREGLPDDATLGHLIISLSLDGAQIDALPGAPHDELRQKDLLDAAHEYARAARSLRDAISRAEVAAPAAKGRQPDLATAARLRLAVDLCRALGGADDAPFWQVFGAVWRMLVGDDPDRPDPPDMQATRKHLRGLRQRGGL